MTSPADLAVPLAQATPAASGRWAQRKWGLIRLASPFALLALWQIGSALGIVAQDVLPAPSLILEAGIELVESGQLADALAVSGIRVIGGWAQSYADAVGLDPKVAEVSQGRSLRLPTELDDEVVASEQKIADLFAESGQTASPAPEFEKWVDRRFNETCVYYYCLTIRSEMPA